MPRFGTPSSSSGGLLHVVSVTLLLLLTMTWCPWDGSSGRMVAAFHHQQQQRQMLSLSGGGSRGTTTTLSPVHHRRRGDGGRRSLRAKTTADVDKVKGEAAAKADKVEIAIDIAIFVTVQLVLRTQCTSSSFVRSFCSFQLLMFF